MRSLHLAALSMLLTLITAAPASAQPTPASSATPSPLSFVVLDNPAPVFTPPVLIAQPKPDFTPCGKLHDKSLRVAFTLQVDQQGLPQHIETKEKSSNKCVDAVALATVQAYRFTPAQQNGKIVLSPIGLVIDASVSSPNTVSLPVLLKTVELPGPSNMLPGTASLRVNLQIGPDGVPHNLKLTSSNNDAFDRAVILAVSQYRFWPAMKDGLPITVDFVLDVTFQKAGR